MRAKDRGGARTRGASRSVALGQVPKSDYAEDQKKDQRTRRASPPDINVVLLPITPNSYERHES